VASRKKFYQLVDGFQIDFDELLVKYNAERTDQDKVCQGAAPMETLIDGKLTSQINSKVLQTKIQIS